MLRFRIIPILFLLSETSNIRTTSLYTHQPLVWWKWPNNFSPLRNECKFLGFIWLFIFYLCFPLSTFSIQKYIFLSLANWNCCCCLPEVFQYQRTTQKKWNWINFHLFGQIETFKKCVYGQKRVNLCFAIKYQKKFSTISKSKPAHTVTRN